MRSLLRLPFLLFVLVAASLAQQPKNPKNPPKPPFPSRILEAKTVFISIPARYAGHYYPIAYKALAEWDRWRIVQDPKDADLILAFGTSTEGVVGVGSGSGTTYGNYSSGTATALAVPAQAVVFAVLDPKSNIVLWAKSISAQLVPSQNVKKPINALRKEIEREEATNANR